MPDQDKEKKILAGLINHVVEQKNIRLQNTILDIREWARENSAYFNTEEIGRIESYLSEFFVIARAQRSALDEKIRKRFER